MDKDCCKTIKLNHPDIEVINGMVSEYLKTLPKADALLGGPPCPEFSRAKADRTFDLCEVNNFLRAREITKCKHHFMENVQDLAKVHKERNFLVNCADYGVPQTRIRRIFTDLPLPKPTHSQFPSNTLFEEPMKKWISVKDALGLEPGFIEDRKTKPSMEPEFRKYDVDKPNHALLTDSRDWYISNSGYKVCNRDEVTRNIDEPADTVVIGSTMRITSYPIKSEKKIRNRIMTLKELKDTNSKWFSKHPPVQLEDPSGTVLAKLRSTPNEYVTDGKFARKLTNEELAVLQGFRADFKFYGNSTSVRKQIGNALPAAISKAFFSQMFQK